MTAAWLDRPGHRRWLDAEGDRLLAFYQWSSLDPAGGMAWLDDRGHRDPSHPRLLWLNARMAHAFALAHLAGRPGADVMARHGVAFLQHDLRDRDYGGWYWADDDPAKQAYGHAFVLLAGASAVQAGLAGPADLLEPAAAVILERFWDEAAGLCVDCYDRDWRHLEAYRGQNANMHMTEAFLAAADATGDSAWATRAARIATRIIELTEANDWRLPEHFDPDWRPLLDYNHDNPENEFRPYGSTIGHWFEWSRLLLQVRATPAGQPWMAGAARTLFARAVAEGWDDERGGIRFTVDWDGRALNDDGYHWVVAEAIGAAAALARLDPDDPQYLRWYRRFWAYADQWLIDHEHGGWHHQLDRVNRPVATVWAGKPDLYHAYQATLAAAMPPGAGFAAGLLAG